MIPREQLIAEVRGRHSLDQDRAALAEGLRGCRPDDIAAYGGVLADGSCGDPFEALGCLVDDEDAEASRVRLRTLFRLARVGLMTMYERGWDTQ